MLGWRHAFWDALRFIGLRDRLRCPQCSAVGTWKPHGGRFDRDDLRKVPRWMCKWCGYYIGPEAGIHRAVPDAAAKCWMLVADATEPLPTPAETIAGQNFHDRPAEGAGPRPRLPVWPWRG